MNEYRKATLEDLNCLWEYNIAINPNDPRWIKWKDTYINYNKTGEAVTFTVIVDNIPVGEGTLLFSSECSAINGRTNLADNSTIANINALRIRKKHEGKGYISTLVRLMEDYAAQNGYKCLTIGVDAKETRNLAIYLHWGYNEFVTSEVEDGELVLYYAKNSVSFGMAKMASNSIVGFPRFVTRFARKFSWMVNTTVCRRSMRTATRSKKAPCRGGNPGRAKTKKLTKSVLPLLYHGIGGTARSNLCPK